MAETVIPRVTIRMLRSEYASQHGGRLYAGDVLNVTYPAALAWVELGIAEAVGGASADQIRQQLNRMRAMDAEIRAQQEIERRARQQMLERIRAEEGQWWTRRAIEATTTQIQVKQALSRDVLEDASNIRRIAATRYGQGMVRGYLWSKYGPPRPWSLRLLDVLGRRCLRGATGG